MKYLNLHEHRTLWGNKRFLFSVFLGLIILLIGLEASELARHHLEHTLHQGSWEYDLLLDHLPVMELEYFLVWGLELLFALLVIILALHPGYLPFSLKSIGFLYLIRSFFIILTPLGARPDRVIAPSEKLLYDLAYGSNEFFFSGHTSFPLILALIFWHRPIIRSVLLVATVLFGAAVLLAHTHYSIDVFAVPFIVPTIFVMSKKLFAGDLKYIREQEKIDNGGGLIERLWKHMTNPLSKQ